ncbi:MAG: rhodanese-like domain-containing protein [Polyangiaceae bacterium]
MNSVVWFVFALLLGFMLFRRFAFKVAPAEARALVKSGALLLDVRTEGEFASGHLEGAKNIPVGALSGRLSEVGSDKTRPIVVYCASGMRSATATSMLKRAGYASVHDLGAMARWAV